MDLNIIDVTIHCGASLAPTGDQGWVTVIQNKPIFLTSILLSVKVI